MKKKTLFLILLNSLFLFKVQSQDKKEEFDYLKAYNACHKEYYLCEDGILNSFAHGSRGYNERIGRCEYARDWCVNVANSKNRQYQKSQANSQKKIISVNQSNKKAEEQKKAERRQEETEKQAEERRQAHKRIAKLAEQLKAERIAKQKRLAEQKETKRKELERINAIKKENAVLIAGKDATKFINACIEYMLTNKHEKGFSGYSDELKEETSILQRKSNSKNTISNYLSNGASNQTYSFLSSLEKSSFEINKLDDYLLVQMVYGNMKSSNVGFDIEKIKGNLDLYAISDLISKEEEEERLLPFVKYGQGFQSRANPYNRWGLKSSLTGKVIVEPKYSRLGRYSEGMISAREFGGTFGGMYGYLDKEGNVIVPFIYKDGGSFSSGLANVTKNGKKWGYINKKGEVVIPFKYASATYFGFKYPELARVQKSRNGNYFHINRKGKCEKECR